MGILRNTSTLRPFKILLYKAFVFFSVPTLVLNANDPPPSQTADITLQHPAEIRQHNIELMRNELKNGRYEGYDIIILSSTSKEEADYQQLKLEEVFAGTSTKEGRAPIILSVVDEASAGQLIGSVYTWIEAEKMMRERYPDALKGEEGLAGYIQSHKLKAAAFHNGGKGERCSPLTQSLGNSRGSQMLVGNIRNAQDQDIELDILLGVILQCSSFAKTNQGTHLDTYWTSQIAFGSRPHDALVRSNFSLDKFLVGFPKTELIAQNIADFGTAALSEKGRMTVFYGNKRFAARKGQEYLVDLAKIEEELFSKGASVAYDFGSFAIRYDLWKILIDYWKRKNVLHEGVRVKRDIDPHFIQPCIRLLYAINDLADREEIDRMIPPANLLRSNLELKTAQCAFDQRLKDEAPEAHTYLWKDVLNEKDEKKQSEARACMQEAMEMYLLYHQTPPFSDLEKVFGFIDLGSETTWFRYRRPIDILNDKLDMLTDLKESQIAVQLDGSLTEFKSCDCLAQRSREARLMRGISHERMAEFMVDGKAVALSLSQIKEGVSIFGVYVKNSIIRDSNLIPGSSIVDSIVNHVSGQVMAANSYLESSVAPKISAEASIIHQTVSIEPIEAQMEVISDVYRTKLAPPYHGRMRAPIGYDPKGMPIYKTSEKSGDGSLVNREEFDEAIQHFMRKIPYHIGGITAFSDQTARTDDGQFTFEEVREIEPLKSSDHQFHNSMANFVKKAILFQSDTAPPKQLLKQGE